METPKIIEVEPTLDGNRSAWIAKEYEMVKTETGPQRNILWVCIRKSRKAAEQACKDHGPTRLPE